MRPVTPVVGEVASANTGVAGPLTKVHNPEDPPVGVFPAMVVVLPPAQTL